jgi:hypothetical protein
VNLEIGHGELVGFQKHQTFRAGGCLLPMLFRLQRLK